MKNEITHSECRQGEQGFLLVGVIVMVAIVLLLLSVAAPVVAKDLRREKELEAVHRGEQYTRAIRLYYKKNNAYPASVKILEGPAPQERFLRQHYLDPMTGKDDWRLIGFGQAKTTVKGFFGEPLAGIASTGLGSASGMQSSGTGGTTGQTTGGTTDSGSAFGSPTAGGAPGAGQATDSGSAFGASTTSPASGATSSGSSFGSSTFGQQSTGSGGTGSSQSATDFSGSDGPFVGVGIPKDGASIITLNEQTNYSTWEFLYDPRIEQLYAKSNLFGGGIATQSGGLGSASSLGSATGSASSGQPGSATGTAGESTTTGNPNGSAATPTVPTTTPQ